MMKAKCVNNDNITNELTVGQIYDVILDGGGKYWTVANDGVATWYQPFTFELLSDAPKSEWMQVLDTAYVNMTTGFYLDFGIKNGHHESVISTMNSTEMCHTVGKYADAFAALVNYKWSE
jgi:hypothetical protein